MKKRNNLQYVFALMLAGQGWMLGACSTEDGIDSGTSGGGSSTNGGTSDGGAYSLSSGTAELSGKTLTSSTSDVNAVQVAGGTLTLTGCTILKSGGDTSNSDNSSFYGTNAAVLASGSGKIVMDGGTITTDAVGANGIVAYGGTVEVSDVTITNSKILLSAKHSSFLPIC